MIGYTCSSLVLSLLEGTWLRWHQVAHESSRGKTRPLWKSVRSWTRRARPSSTSPLPGRARPRSAMGRSSSASAWSTGTRGSRWSRRTNPQATSQRPSQALRRAWRTAFATRRFWASREVARPSRWPRPSRRCRSPRSSWSPTRRSRRRSRARCASSSPTTPSCTS